jgi:hypothetical protein
MDRMYTEWANQRCKVIYKIQEGLPAAALAPRGGGGMEYSAQMAAAILTGMRGAPEAEREENEKFAYHKKLMILAACRLHPEDWDQVPLIYGKMTQDGIGGASGAGARISGNSIIGSGAPIIGIPIYTTCHGCKGREQSKGKLKPKKLLHLMKLSTL